MEGGLTKDNIRPLNRNRQVGTSSSVRSSAVDSVIAELPDREVAYDDLCESELALDKGNWNLKSTNNADDKRESDDSERYEDPAEPLLLES